MPAPLACHNHPDVTNHIQPCRVCEQAVCQECRESQYGSGIPVIVCSDCAAAQRRKAALRRSSTVVLVVCVLAAVVLAMKVAALAAIIPLLISAAWLFVLWRRYRSGMFSTRDGIWGAFLLGRFFR